ncbi:hypothetical protein BD410DRAFT_696105, partial [Rickenella mellea]
MHNLFLGLVQFHFRTALGINIADAHTEEPEIEERALVKARKILATKPYPSTLSKLSMPILRLLCAEKPVPLPQGVGGKPVRKADIISALLVIYPVLPPRDAKEKLEFSLEDPSLFTERVNINSKVHVESCVSKGDLKNIQSHIINTTRPNWQVPPPSHFGEPGHGKLKADEWRSTIEFDLPVSLVQVWSGTEKRTSKRHSNMYMKYMHDYLESLLELFPDLRLRPNHHNALHIGELLLRFGPMHGWWMYPFERVIGILQRMNTNNKLGQLEKTMLESFCAAANIRAFMKQPGCPAVLKDTSEILDRVWGGADAGTLKKDMMSL